MKWADAFSKETKMTIIGNLEQLVTGFGGVLKLINTELSCLGD